MGFGDDVSRHDQRAHADRAGQVADAYDRGWQDALDAATERVTSAGSIAEAVDRLTRLRRQVHSISPSG